MAKKDIYNYEDVKSAMSGMNIAVFYLIPIKILPSLLKQLHVI